MGLNSHWFESSTSHNRKSQQVTLTLFFCQKENAKAQELRTVHRPPAGLAAAPLLRDVQFHSPLSHFRHPATDLLGRRYQEAEIQHAIRLDYHVPSGREHGRLRFAEGLGG